MRNTKPKATAQQRARAKAPPATKAALPLSYTDLCTAATMLGFSPAKGPIAEQVTVLLVKSLQQQIIKRVGEKYELVR